VADHTNDAEHGSTAVVALDVELEGLDLRVIITHPFDLQVLHDISWVVLRKLLEDGNVERRDERHDLRPARKRNRRVGAREVTRDSTEVDALRDGEGARQAEASLGDDDTKRGSHCDPPVLDLDLLVAAVRIRATAEEAERVEEAEWRCDADIALWAEDASRSDRSLPDGRLLDGRPLDRSHLLHR